MKKINYYLEIAVFLSIGLFFAGCSDSSKTDATDKTSTEQTSEQTSGGEVVTVSLPSIQCNMCKKTITNALKEVDGVKDVDVNVKQKTVNVSYDKSKTDAAKVEACIVAAGYDANDKKANPEAYNNLHDCCKKPEDQKGSGDHM